MVKTNIKEGLFKMMRKNFLFGIVVFSLAIAPFALANGLELSDEEIVRRSDRLDAINEKLQQTLPDQERSGLLFGKAQLMFDTFGPLYLRTATEALLKAIQISSQKRYEDLLFGAYDLYWKDRDLSGEDPVSKDLSALRKKCEEILSARR